MNAREQLWQWLLEVPTSMPRTPAAQALDRKLVTQIDLVRLKVIARLHARGLEPQMDWTDLLQEAFRRVLDGSRLPPDGVPIVAFLAGVMRSIKSEQRRRMRGGPFDMTFADSTEDLNEELRDPAADPLRSLIAIEEVEVLRGLFAEDTHARQIIEGLYEGCTSEEIRERNSLSVNDYDAARKRIRRMLIREGLRWNPEA